MVFFHSKGIMHIFVAFLPSWVFLTSFMKDPRREETFTLFTGLIGIYINETMYKNENICLNCLCRFFFPSASYFSPIVEAP